MRSEAEKSLSYCKCISTKSSLVESLLSDLWSIE